MAWYNPSWTYRKPITIDHTKVPSTLSNFTVGVFLTSSNFTFANARSDGFDVIFTAADGTTLLTFERSRYSNGSQVGEFWVKTSSLSSSSDTTIYMYYGNSGATDSSSASGAWNTTYKSVYHLEEGNATAVDSIGTNNLTKTGTMTQSTGQVGKAVSGFTGSNYLNKTGGTLFTSGNADRTMFFSVNFNSVPSVNDTEYYITMAGNWTNNQMYSLILGKYSGTVKLNVATYADDVTYAYTPSTGTWLRFAVVYTASSKNSQVYLNGSSLFSGTHTNNSSFPTAGNQAIGIGNNGISLFAYPTDGIMDEAYYYDAAASSDWITVDYNSINNTLISLGSEETNTVSVTGGTLALLGV